MQHDEVSGVFISFNIIMISVCRTQRSVVEVDVEVIGYECPVVCSVETLACASRE